MVFQIKTVCIPQLVGWGGVTTHKAHHPLVHTFNLLSFLSLTFVTAVALLLTEGVGILYRYTCMLFIQTEQERNLRLQTLRTNQARRLIHENEQERNLRLQTRQRNDAQRLINENEEQRNLRLQRLRESQSIRIEAETEQQRLDRLQIARDNTARRIEVETKNQLLQQNGAMYRGNERLQHLQDQNNRDSYLSNGWRNAEQPLQEQQWFKLRWQISIVQ